jgi:lysyl-tRNA synthetase, class II
VSGFDALPRRFAQRSAIAEARAAHEALAAGEEATATYRLAGRVMARRDQGRVVFADLEDRSGRLQLLVSADNLDPDSFQRFARTNLGDVIGVTGSMLRTRRGELSLRVESFQLLAPCRRPLPDTRHGLRDLEARYRQRYLDLVMRPEARRLVERRSTMVTAIRHFLDQRGFLEVETPVLQPAPSGEARPFQTHHNTLDRDLYLRVATELYLKRLIVGGLERVYEIGRVFRNEGVSFKHNPEFTMLESYEAYADGGDVMRMTEQMVADAAQATLATTSMEIDGRPIDFQPPWPRIPLAEAIEQAAGINPMPADGSRDPEPLRARLHADGVDTSRDTTWAALVDHLLSHYVEPTLTAPTFLVDYPIELSPFAREWPDRPGIVERFEAFCGGIEIANGYSELNDPDEQRRRLLALRASSEAGVAAVIDEDYITALEYGMPPTGGLGVGIDRVAKVLLGAASIREVVLFPALRDR